MRLRRVQTRLHSTESRHSPSPKLLVFSLGYRTLWVAYLAEEGVEEVRAAAEAAEAAEPEARVEEVVGAGGRQKEAWGARMEAA